MEEFSLYWEFYGWTKVRGTLVKQKDNSIAILVEFIQRGGQVVTADIDFVPETRSTDLDEKIINNIAKSLAVKSDNQARKSHAPGFIMGKYVELC